MHGHDRRLLHAVRNNLRPSMSVVNFRRQCPSVRMIDSTLDRSTHPPYKYASAHLDEINTRIGSLL